MAMRLPNQAGEGGPSPTPPLQIDETPGGGEAELVTLDDEPLMLGLVYVNGAEPHHRLAVRWRARNRESTAALRLAFQIVSSWR